MPLRTYVHMNARARAFVCSGALRSAGLSTRESASALWIMPFLLLLCRLCWDVQLM